MFNNLASGYAGESFKFLLRLLPTFSIFLSIEGALTRETGNGLLRHLSLSRRSQRAGAPALARAQLFLSPGRAAALGSVRVALSTRVCICQRSDASESGKCLFVLSFDETFYAFAHFLVRKALVRPAVVFTTR